MRLVPKGLGSLLVAGALLFSSEALGADRPSQISTNGIALLKQFEGYSPKVYNDSAGKPTIGYGHLLRTNEHLTEITGEKAEQLLREDIRKAESAVERHVTAPLTQNQYDALVSFTYNIGEGNFRDSTLLRHLNSTNYAVASEEFKRWVYAGGKKVRGLENRRNKEKQLFTSK